MIITPRAYQTNAINAARKAVANGAKAPLIVAPTGAGKTTIASIIAKAHQEKGGRVVWLAHRRELVQQGAARLRLFGLDVGAEGLNANAPVQVVMAQTVLARREAPKASLAIFDEAHHYVADEWGEAPRVYRQAGSVLVGLTATPERQDGVGLGGVFDAMIVVAQIRDLMNEIDPATGRPYLVRCRVLTPPAPPPTGTLEMSPFEAWSKHTPGRPAVVFAASVQAAHDHAAEFHANGVRVGVVHGKLADDKRERILDDFANGRLDVLCNVMVLTEGWDCPRAKVCILARPVGSPSLFLQIVGRVLRPDESGDDAVLLDLVGAVSKHGDPDEERIYSLDGRACRRAGETTGDRFCRRCGGLLPADGSPCADCGAASTRVAATPESRHGDLVDRYAWTKDVPADKQVGMLANMIRKAIKEGASEKRASVVYKAMFKRWPNRAQLEAAEAIVGREKSLARAFVAMGQRINERQSAS